MNRRIFSLTATIFFSTNLLSTSAVSQTVSKPQADSIYIHANIYTGVVGDSSFHEVQRAQALAVRGDKVLSVGSEPEILKLKGPQTNVVDLGGNFVLPGFN